MKNKKRAIIIGSVCVALVAVIAGITIARSLNRVKQAVDDYAVSRTQEEEGDIHYIDDEAIALSG